MASEQAGLEVRSSWHYSAAEDNYHLEGGGLNRQHSRAMSRRSIRPRKRKCRSPYRHVTFSVIVFFILATYGAIVHSYYDGILIALETRFDISHTTSQCIMYVRDVASVLTLIFACYFGSRSHSPRVVSLGAFICGVGIVCCGLPHFINQDEISELETLSSNNTIRSTTEEPVPQTDMYGEITSNLLCSVSGKNAHSKLHIGNCPKKEPFLSFPELSRTVLLIVGQILCGIGIGPILPISVMYLDDAIDKPYTSAVVGVFIVALVVGPMGGYFAWQYCLDLPVDFYLPRAADSDLVPGDPDWIGAWWLCFIAGGVFIVFLGILLLLFPRSLRPDAHDDDIDGEEDVAYRLIVKKRDKAREKGCLRGLCFSLGRLFKNAAYVSMTVGLTCEVAIISGFLFLAAKYMLKQFETDFDTATVIVVTISLPGIILGQIIGSFIIRRWRLDAKCCARMIFFMCVVSVCCTPLLILIGCKSPRIAGYTMSYPTALGNVSMASKCNTNCGCDEHVYEPVCDGNGVTYVSPCHAGCRNLLQEDMYKYVDAQVQNRTIYTACQCVHWDFGYAVNPSGGYAFKGSCQSDWECDQKIYMFVGAYVALSLITSILGNPAFVVVIRCVHTYDRAMAIGVTSLIVRTLGFIPASFYFGAILEAGCWIRDFSCGDEGDCLLYDVDRYRYIFIGLFLCLKFVALIAYTVTNSFVQKEADEERYEKIPMTAITDSHSEDLMGTDV